MEVTIQFDPSEDKVLGVTKRCVFVRSNGYEDLTEYNYEHFDCVLQIPKAEYKRVWNNWLKGKQNHCETWGHFCGILGHTDVKDYVQLEDTEVYDWDDELEDMKAKPAKMFYVTKFSDHHDFEHG